MNVYDLFKKHLKEKGLFATPERVQILESVFEIHAHFDIEELYEYIKSRPKCKNISRATIYRTIPVLAECKLIREVSRNEGKVRYEHIFGHDHHDHLICVKCGRIIEFKNDTIEKLQNDICKKYKFMPVEHNLGIKGYCSKCKIKK